jgi:hypothetical protein
MKICVEYAAAFFLLADSLKDAVTVLMNQLSDTQLAIAVARVYEGDSGPVLSELLREQILPKAATDGNRWLASWAFWMLNQRDMAVRVLVVSFLDTRGYTCKADMFVGTTSPASRLAAYSKYAGKVVLD